MIRRVVDNRSTRHIITGKVHIQQTEGREMKRILQRAAMVVTCAILGAVAIGQSQTRIPEDPGCYLESYSTACVVLDLFHHQCSVSAVFQHHDTFGNPLQVWASVVQKCYVVNMLLPFIKVYGTAAESGQGYGTLTLNAECIITYGTDYGVCFGVQGYPRFQCSN
jgi:hypothetical protein